MEIDRIDHFVLTVSDPDATCEFYERVLGMEPITFSGGRRALRFGEQKINLHQAGREFEPKASHPVTGSADFCLITHAPISEVVARLASTGVQILQGPVQKEGALGEMESVYFRDPDGNLLEVSVYAG
jgi:catechol 2,3-dioxygenase-like lactoylglutathione lyase family enzyme